MADCDNISTKMLPLIGDNLAKLHQIADAHRVSRLDLIGSATRSDFNAENSDLDFVVEFDASDDQTLADRYFGLLHDLEDLFQRPIDLISYRAIRNPFFKQVVDQTRQTLYAA
jgi:predicted nucleotidyltransferase